MTGIQEEDGGPLRLIIDNGVFFEFIPAEREDEADPPRLHIGEVEDGAGLRGRDELQRRDLGLPAGRRDPF